MRRLAAQVLRLPDNYSVVVNGERFQIACQPTEARRPTTNRPARATLIEAQVVDRGRVRCSERQAQGGISQARYFAVEPSVAMSTAKRCTRNFLPTQQDA
jgi:hypothetical protein